MSWEDQHLRNGVSYIVQDKAEYKNVATATEQISLLGKSKTGNDGRSI